MSCLRRLLIVLLWFLSACADSSPSQSPSTSQDKKPQVQAPHVEVIDLPLDREYEKKLQRWVVEEGHQPWRFNAYMVACAYIPSESDVGDCWNNYKIEHEDETKAVVSFREGNVHYRVYLERVVEPGGIWTPRRIEIIRP